MKKTTILISNLLIIIFLLVLPISAAGSEPYSPNLSRSIFNYGKYRKDIGVNIDMGLNGSGDYKTVIQNHFYGEELSGGFLWLSLGIGLDFRLINNLYIEPRITWLTHSLSVPSLLAGYNNEKINDVFLPGIGMKYYIFLKTPLSEQNEYNNFGIYVDGRIYKNKPSTEISDLMFTSGGAAKNLSLGLHVGIPIGAVNFELGNRWIPVKVNEEAYSRNFGGIYAEVSGVFYLFNYSGIKGKLKK